MCEQLALINVRAAITTLCRRTVLHRGAAAVDDAVWRSRRLRLAAIDDCGAAVTNCDAYQRLLLSRIEIESVLAVVGKARVNAHQIAVQSDARVLLQTLLVGAVAMQIRHKVGERARHAKLNFQFARAEYQRLFVRQRIEAKESNSLGRTPFATVCVLKKSKTRINVLFSHFLSTIYFQALSY